MFGFFKYVSYQKYNIIFFRIFTDFLNVHRLSMDLINLMMIMSLESSAMKMTILMMRFGTKITVLHLIHQAVLTRIRRPQVMIEASKENRLFPERE